MVDGWGQDEWQRAQVAATLSNVEALLQALALSKGIKLQTKARAKDYQLSPADAGKPKKPAGRRQSWDAMSGILGGLG